MQDVFSLVFQAEPEQLLLPERPPAELLAIVLLHPTAKAVATGILGWTPGKMAMALANRTVWLWAASGKNNCFEQAGLFAVGGSAKLRQPMPGYCPSRLQLNGKAKG